MEKQKKYQLVAWTSNAVSKDEMQVLMIPSVHHDMQEAYFKNISRYRKGNASVRKLRKLIDSYEENIRFFIITGHYGDAIRMTGYAAIACVETDEWEFIDTDLGSYDYFYGKMRSEFFRLYGQFNELIRKYGRHDILLEESSIKLKETFDRITEMDSDLYRHLREMKAWKRHF